MKFFRFVSTLIFTFCFFIFSAQTIFANTKVQIPQDADFWSDFPHEDLANFLVENGVKGIWNFASIDLQLSDPTVVVENVHLSDSLMRLSYKLTNQN